MTVLNANSGRRQWIVGLLISLILHLLLAWAFFSGSKINELKSENKNTLTIEVLAHNPQPLGKITKLVRPNKKPLPSGLKNFKPQFHPYDIPAPKSLPDGVPVGGAVVQGEDDPSEGWGQGGGHFERLADFGLMDRIHQQVDGLLVYAGIFVKHKVVGTVNARVVLNAQGRCDWPNTKIESSEAHLRIYILDILKNLCQQEFSHYLNGRTKTNVDLSFSFALTEHDDRDLIAQQNKIVGNILFFYRNNQQSVLEWHLGPFRGLFPIPAVMVDFDWLKENWETVVERKAPQKMRVD